MGIVSGGGGSFAGGTVTAPTTIHPAADTATVLTLQNAVGGTQDMLDCFDEAGNAVLAVGIGGVVCLSTDTSALPLRVLAHSGQAAELVRIEDATPTDQGGYSKNCYWYTKKNTVPADAELIAGQLMLWFDKTNGASKLMVKAKQADGTVKTASIALA